MITERNTLDSFVYFIRSGDYIKIGCTTNIDARLDQFRTSNPIIELLALIRGGREEEHKLHQRFEELRLKANREWFRYDDELKDFVENMGAPVYPQASFKCDTWLDHINAKIQELCIPPVEWGEVKTLAENLDLSVS
jgi:hypothetical protein